LQKPASRAGVEVDLSEFFQPLCGMGVQIIDCHVMIRRSHGSGERKLDIRVVDSSFAFVETDSEAILRAGSGAKLVGIGSGVISGLNFIKSIRRLAAAEGDNANDDRYSKRAGW